MKAQFEQPNIMQHVALSYAKLYSMLLLEAPPRLEEAVLGLRVSEVRTVEALQELIHTENKELKHTSSLCY